MNRNVYVRSTKFFFAGLLAAFLLASCGSVFLTGRKQLMLVSDQEVLALSLQQYRSFMDSAEVVVNTADAEMINRIGRSIAESVENFMTFNGRAHELENIDWEFSLVKDNSVNAFAMPGGKVVVFTGMLPVAESDSLNQLAHWLDPLSSDALTISGLDPNQLNPARRITNLRPTDSIAGLRHENPGNGFLFGHNSFEYKIFAEEFRQDSNSMLKGVYLVPSKGVKSSSSPVYIDVMKGGFVPEETLVSVELNPYYLEYRNRNFHETSKVHFANAENYVCFDPPLSVGKHFYVAIRLVYPSKTVAAIDSFALYSAYHKERTAKNTVWVNNGTDWEFFTAMNRRAHSSSLWLEPVVMKDTLPVVEPPLVVDTLSQRIPLYYSLQDRLLHISFPTGWRSPFEIRIFDPAGRLMHFTSTEQETMTLYIPESFKGFYIIQLTERRRRYVQKIVF
jgi:hypothetical protein